MADNFNFDFLDDSGASQFDDIDELNPRQPGGIRAALADPNIQNLLSDLGTGFSQGKPAGEVIGGAGGRLVKNRQIQQLLAKLIGDPGSPGASAFGDKEDPNTFDSLNIDNKGFTLKGPNPGVTKPFGESVVDFTDLQDEPLESQAGIGFKTPDLNLGLDDEFPAPRGRDLPDFL